MPYISQERRYDMDVGYVPTTPGELNYCITKIVCEYAEAKPDPQVSYALLNEIMGALECAKQEFYRRVCAPYEDIKRKQNGDVYGEPDGSAAPEEPVSNGAAQEDDDTREAPESGATGNGDTLRPGLDVPSETRP